MFEHGALWGLATVLGPVLLLAAMVYGVMTYRRRPRSKKLTEASTRALYWQAGQRERRQEAAHDPVSSPPLAPGGPSRDSARAQDWREVHKARDQT